jgi:hypothetical protein
MIEIWLKYAHPGLPRAAAWFLAWLVLPLILPVAVVLELLTHGAAEGGNLLRTVYFQIAWLWRQRLALSTDPWKRIR